MIRMKSYSGMESSAFSSKHVAWRASETLSEPYCDQDDIANQLLLRWTEASTANATRFWQLPPAGFGIFIDVRNGLSLLLPKIGMVMLILDLLLVGTINVKNNPIRILMDESAEIPVKSAFMVCSDSISDVWCDKSSFVRCGRWGRWELHTCSRW